MSRTTLRTAKRRQRHTFETLEARLALSVNLAYAETFPGITSPITLALDNDGGVYAHHSLGDNPVTRNDRPGFEVRKHSREGAMSWSAVFEASGEYPVLDSRRAAVDSNGNMFIPGVLSGGRVDFDPGPGGYLSPIVERTAPRSFLLKLTTEGELDWVQLFPTSVSIGSVAVNSVGDLAVVLLAGESCDIDFGPGEAIYSSTRLVAQYRGSDASLLRVHEFVGAQDYIPTISLAPFLNDDSLVVAVRYTEGDIDLDPGPGTYIVNGSPERRSSSLVRLDSDGDFVASYEVNAFAGGVQIHSIDVDTSGNVLLAGRYTGSVDFDAGSAVVTPEVRSDESWFILRMSETNQFDWLATFSDDTPDEVGSPLSIDSVQVDGSGNVYLAGGARTQVVNGHIDVDPGPGVQIVDTTSFLLSLTPEGSYRWHTNVVNGHNGPPDMAVSIAGDVWLSGWFWDEMSPVDLDPSDEVSLATTDYHSAYLVKLIQDDISLPGDTNDDGQVNLEDLNNVRNHFGGTGAGILGDTNGDETVDLEDLNAVRNNFGATVGGPSAMVGARSLGASETAWTSPKIDERFSARQKRKAEVVDEHLFAWDKALSEFSVSTKPRRRGTSISSR